MAADFFARQDDEPRRGAPGRVLFVLAVIAIVVSVHVVLGTAFGFLDADPRTGEPNWLWLRDPGLLALSLFGTVLIVGAGSLFKIVQLRGGGRVVAESLGGRLITPDTADASEQQLINVVEEMAIAAGTPTPPVYLLDEERSINAFAAGFTPTDAVVGVTRGTLDRLTRDELQGVIAHEFSHIFNGDMRLNIRLIGLLHGILIVGMLGYFVLRMTAFSGHRRRGSRNQGNPLPLIAIGAGLMIVGFFGTFFGNLIKAAVSRQREFLADASAVQYTRLPDGIAGALKKIGAGYSGARLATPNAPEASHLFFGRGTTGFSALFSTHPPIGDRIRRIDPAWDGRFPEARPEAARGVIPQAPRVAPQAASRLADEAVLPADLNRSVVSAFAHIGQPTPEHLQYAGRLIARLPRTLVDAAHDPYGARALVYALLLDPRPATRHRQLAHLASAADPDVVATMQRMLPAVDALEVHTRLPLLELTLSALRELTALEAERFRRNVDVLMHADARIDLFEWALHRILVHDLDGRRASAGPPRIRHRAVTSVREECELLLSMLAHAGHENPDVTARAFASGHAVLGLKDLRLRPRDESSLEALDAALVSLDEASPEVKRNVLHAAVACVTTDRTVTPAEAELLRGVAAALSSPMPPLIG